MNRTIKIPPTFRVFALVLTINICAYSQFLSWRDTNLPGGGTVTALDSIPGGMLSGTANGRIFRSVDDGGTWQLAMRGAGSPLLDFLQLNGAWLAAAGTKGYSAIADCFSGMCGPDPTAMGGLYRSVDSGATWVK